jgi:hypothetical protein
MDTTSGEPNVAEPSTLRRGGRRYRIGARDWLQFAYLVAAVLIVGYLGLFIFALLFNEVTIFAWLFIGGFFAFRHGFIEYRNKLAVSGTATAKASSAAIGLAELLGRGSAADVKEAPVSRTPCLFWSVEVHQWSTQSKRRGWQSKLHRSFGVETLELEDESGRVLVWTRGAEIITVKQVWRSEDGDPPESALRLVAATGIPWPQRSSAHPMKITEERIAVDGPLYVMGTLAERRQIPDTPKAPWTRFLTRWADTAPRLDDQSFIAALRFAFQGGRRWLAREFQPAVPRWTPPNVDQHQVLVWKGDQGRPFIIAGLLEPDALKALSRRAWLYILGGGGLMAGTLLVAVWKLTDTIR